MELVLEFVEVGGVLEVHLPHLLLLVVEPLGHLRQFLVLLEHEGAQTVVFLAEILEVAGVLLLLLQHFLHFLDLGVLLGDDLEEFVVLVL